MKAMVFAAGLGTRLQNETAAKPKALVDVAGRPLLHHAIEKLKKAGVSEVVVNVHHFADQVIEYVSSTDFGIKINISDEREKLLETGGGLKKAAHFFIGSDPVLIYNVDILSDINLEALMTEHLQSGALATLAVRKRDTQRFFKFDVNKQLVGWINKKTGETKISRPGVFDTAEEMAFSGIHVVSPAVFELMPEADRFSIADFYIEIAKTHTIKAFYDSSDLWIDVGKPEQLDEARKFFG